MFKYVFIISLFFTSVFAQNTPVKNQELSSSDMKSKNAEIAKLAAAEITKSLPQDVDKFTKLLSCEAKDSMLVYTFELNVESKSDEELKKDGLSKMKKSVTEGTCRSSKRFLEADINIRYIYNSAKSKAKLFSFDVDKSNCGYKNPLM